VEETSATTTFIGQGEVTEAMQWERKTIPESFIMSGTTHCHQEIQEFLMKPIDIASNDIGTASSGLLLTINLPEDIISSPVYAQKLYGYQGVRGTIRLRLTLSANPFQQGRLILAFHPQGQVAGVLPGLRLLNLQTITQLPHVEIDLACQSEVDLLIPYTNPKAFYDLVANTGHWGQAYLYVYSPLKTGSGGSTTVGYTIFASFEKDLTLVNPTLFTAPPPELLVRAKARRKMPTTKNIAAAKSNTVYASYQMMNLKKGSQLSQRMRTNAYQIVGRGQNATEQEAEGEAKTGSITKALQGVHSIVKSATSIPILSDLAAPVSWATGIASGLASAFGWAKPRFDTPFTQHCTVNQLGLAANVDGASLAMPMGLSATNKVQVLPGFAGSNVDEMAFDHLVPIPAWGQTVNWKTVDPTGTILYSKSLNPRAWEIAATDGTVQYHTTYPMSYINRFLLYYRGTIRHRIKLVKTVYHKGKLLVVFLPGVTGATPSLEDTAYLHRSIIDLTEGNEMEFEFPYTQNDFYTAPANSYGQVLIMVVNELVAPSTCANNIDLLIEVSGAPGFEFAIPRDIPLFPYVPSTVLAALEGRKKEKEKTVLNASFQMADIKKTDTQKGSPCVVAKTAQVGCAEMDQPTLMPASYCIGERITSLLQLAKAAVNPYWQNRGTGTAPLVAGQSWSIRPTSTVVTTSDGSNNVMVRAMCGDWISAIQACYQYSRGSIRLLYNHFGRQGTELSSYLFYTALGDTLSPPVAPWTFSTYDQSGQRSAGATNGMSMGVEVPHYSTLPAHINRLLPYGVNEPVDPYASKVRVILHTSNNQLPTALYRSAGDDYQCGMFLGTPPVIANAIMPMAADPPPPSFSGPETPSGLLSDSVLQLE
jgi:hypothetical protein